MRGRGTTAQTHTWLADEIPTSNIKTFIALAYMVEQQSTSSATRGERATEHLGMMKQRRRAA